MLFLLYCHGNWHQHSVLASPRLDVFKDLIVSRKFARLLLSMVLNRFFSPPLYLGVPLELMRKLVKATTSASPFGGKHVILQVPSTLPKKEIHSHIAWDAVNSTRNHSWQYTAAPLVEAQTWEQELLFMSSLHGSSSSISWKHISQSSASVLLHSQSIRS